MLKSLYLTTVLAATLMPLPEVALSQTTTTGFGSETIIIGPSTNRQRIVPSAFFNRPQTIIIGPSTNQRRIVPSAYFNRPETFTFDNPGTFSSDFNRSQTVIINDQQTVAPSDFNRSQTVIIDSGANPRTIFPADPFNKSQTVIIDNSRNFGPGINQPFQQFGCGSVILGSPIPSPVPVTPSGQLCRRE